MKRLDIVDRKEDKFILFDQHGDRYRGTPVKKEGLDLGVVCLDLYHTFGLSGAERIGEVHIDALGHVVWAENELWAESEVKSA